MRRPEFIARQSRCPSGLLGRLIGRIMESETAAENDATLEALSLTPSDHVLEIGFGPGRALERAAAKVPHGRVVGVEISEDMTRIARRRCADLIRQGRVELRLAEASSLPFPDASFDKVYSVHTVYFWSQPSDVLREVRRVLRRGGGVALCFRPKDDAHTRDFPESVYRFFGEDDLAALLRDAGFLDVTIAPAGTASQLRIATARS